LYAVMGACRLARFNAGPKRLDEFQGMPTTAVAFMVALTCLTCPSLNSTLGLGLVVTLALLMVSHFPYPKLVKILECPPWAWAVLLGLARYNFIGTVWACMAGYIISGPVIGMLRSRGGQEEWTVQRPQAKG
jgi:CDP-diacylglycerol--serine O-phosphatidyltransferase